MSIQSMFRGFFIVAVAVAVAGLAACNGGGSPSSRSGSAHIAVNLTDFPLDNQDVQSVMVTLTDVIVYPDEEAGSMSSAMEPAPIHLMTHPQTFDLLTLTGGATALLASGEVPAGMYSRIRLGVSDAMLVWKDPTLAPVSLKIESDKVDVPIRFTATMGTSGTLTLDFNAQASVQVNQTSSGRYILRPVVTPVQ